MSTSIPATEVQEPLPEPKPLLWFSLTLSILMIVAGLLAIVLAAETSIAVTIIAAWFLMIGGVVQAVHAFRSKGVGPIIWKVVVALAYFATGFFLRMHPGFGLAALSLAVIWFFIIGGVVSLVTFFGSRKKGTHVWVLLDGIVSMLLGFLLFEHWPSRAAWLVGVFVGVNLLMNGMTRLMLTLAVRRALKAAGEATA